MSLVPSLLQAIVRVDGEALVMHVGEKPYVVAPSGQVDLATKGLTLEAVTGIVGQLLPSEAMRALDDLGATQFELPPMTEFPDHRFTVTAARGGDDVWAEIRRRPVVEDVPATQLPLEATAPAPLRNDETADALALPREDQLWPASASEDAPSFPDDSPLVLGAPESTVLHVEDRSESDPVPMSGVAATGMSPTDRLAPRFESSLEAALDRSGLWAIFPDTQAVVRSGPVPEAESEGVAEWSFDPERVGALGADSLWATDRPEPALSVPLAPPVESLELAAELLLPSESPLHLVPSPTPLEDVSLPQPEPVDDTARPTRSAFAEWRSSLEFALPEDWPTAIQAAVTAATTAGSHPPLASGSAVFELAQSAPPVVASPLVTAAWFESVVPLASAILPAETDRVPPTTHASVGATPVVPSSARIERELVQQPDSSVSVSRSAEFLAEAREPGGPAAALSQPGVVVPIDRSGPRPDVGWHAAEASAASLEKIVRLAVGRGASTLYLSSFAKPAARIDGEIQTLEGVPTLNAAELEATLLAALPERHAAALRVGQPTEWVWDLFEIGRVRCSIFNDHRGPGAVCRFVSVRALSADERSLSREIQALSAEAEGLIVVSGPRGGGKSTLIASLVELINRNRRDYVIAFEREINLVYERQAAFVSQRETRGSADDMANAARAALREDPDVLVFDELNSAALMDVALDASQAGRLVLAGVRAPHLVAAIDRLVEMQPPERRRHVQAVMAQNLRAAVAQVLVKKSSGGRVAAREVLFHSPIVATVLAEGKTTQLPMAIEGGRRQGMVSLNDALAGFVQKGAVDVREAYRHATDRAGLLDLLRRQGIDTSLIERLA